MKKRAFCLLFAVLMVLCAHLFGCCEEAPPSDPPTQDNTDGNDPPVVDNTDGNDLPVVDNTDENGDASDDTEENGDAAAVTLGYHYRVGDVATGEPGEVYFADLEGAIASAATGVSIYRISGDAPEAVFAKGTGDSLALEKGLTVRVGEASASDAEYYASIEDAMRMASSGATITLIGDTALDSALTLDGKNITVTAAEDVALTLSAALTLKNDVTLSFHNMTLIADEGVLKPADATNGHSIAFHNVDLTAANAFLTASQTKLCVTVADCVLSAAPDTASGGMMYFGADTAVTAMSVSNTTLNATLFKAQSDDPSKVVIGTAASPILINNVTGSATLLHTCGCTVYAEINGGAYTGGLLYSADAPNTVDIRLNPAGNTHTAFVLRSADKRDAFVYQDAVSGNLIFSFCNTTVTDTGAAPHLFFFEDGASHTVHVSASNAGFVGGAHQALHNLSDASAFVFDNDDAAVAFGYPVRVGADAMKGYYRTLAEAIAAAEDGDTVHIFGEVSGTGITLRGKSITLKGELASKGARITNTDGTSYLFSCTNAQLTVQNLTIDAGGRAFKFAGRAENSLRIEGSDVIGIASGATQNMLYVLTSRFDFCLDQSSSMGYVAGRGGGQSNYSVIRYEVASVSGDLLIHGRVYSTVVMSDTAAQELICLGNTDSFVLNGSVVIGETAELALNVSYPTDKDPYDYPGCFAGTLIRMRGKNTVLVQDISKLTVQVNNGSESRVNLHSALEAAYTPDGAAPISGMVYYPDINTILSFLLKNEYKDSNKQNVVAQQGHSEYRFIYDQNAFYEDWSIERHEAGQSGYKDTPVGAHSLVESYFMGKKVMNELFGISVPYGPDSATAVDKEIVVGITNRDKNRAYLNMIQPNECAIIINGERIWLLAWNDEALDRIVAVFKELMASLRVGGKFVLPRGEDLILKMVADEAWIHDFAKPEGTLWGSQYVNNSSLQYVYKGYANAVAGHEAFQAYRAQLVADGYVRVWENAIGNNLFAMYTNARKGHSVYFAYNDFEFKSEFEAAYQAEKTDIQDLGGYFSGVIADDTLEPRDYQKCIRVISIPTAAMPALDPESKLLNLNKSMNSYVKITDTKLAMVGLEGSSIGMSHVYMLENGQFLIMDGGGTATGNTVEDLYNVMVTMYNEVHAQDFRPGTDKLHIAAWYLTHTHQDHGMAFYRLLTHQSYAQYRQDLKVDYVIANTPIWGSVMKGALLEVGQGDFAAMREGLGGEGFEYIKVHTGQTIYIANLEIEVLMTYEDHAPFEIVSTNDINVITRFTVHNKDARDGRTAQVLNLGDAQRHTSRFLCEMYGDYLQTEIVQVAHHGNNGAERILYKTIKPKAAIVPNDTGAFKSYFYTLSGISSANAFKFAANVWIAKNVEYLWAAPANIHNVLVFAPGGPDYAGVYTLGGVYTPGEGLLNYKSYSGPSWFASVSGYIHND